MIRLTEARPVHELVAVQAARRPEAPAVSARDGVLTYAELDRRSTQLAHRLRRVGVSVESPVGLCLPRSAALVVGALGILKAGGAYVAIDPAYPDDRIDFMLADSDAVAVVTDAAGAARLAGRPGVVVVDAAEPVADPAPIPEAAIKGGDLAYVVYTSGSTGRPKGVAVEHASLLNLVGWHRRAFSIAPADRGMQFASPGFDAVVWEIWPYLTAGASVHVPSDSLRIDPAALRDWLVDERITVCFVPTALAEEILALAWPRDGSLRILLTGGDALHRHPGPDIPFTVVNNYGPAEATVVATSGIIPASVGAEVSPSLGRAIEGVSTHIVDDSLVPVPAGVAGELLIGGVSVARGYLNMPELTAERFIPDHLGDPAGGRLYRTGDLVRMRADGELDFLGRLDEQVMIRGRRIEPGEISATLDRHPSLRTSAVVAIGDTPEQRRLVACVVAADGHSADSATLRAHLAGRTAGPHGAVRLRVARQAASAGQWQGRQGCAEGLTVSLAARRRRDRTTQRARGSSRRDRCRASRTRRGRGRGGLLPARRPLPPRRTDDHPDQRQVRRRAASPRPVRGADGGGHGRRGGASPRR